MSTPSSPGLILETLVVGLFWTHFGPFDAHTGDARTGVARRARAALQNGP